VKHCHLLFQLGKRLANPTPTSIYPFPFSEKLGTFLRRLVGKVAIIPQPTPLKLKSVTTARATPQKFILLGRQVVAFLPRLTETNLTEAVRKRAKISVEL